MTTGTLSTDTPAAEYHDRKLGVASKSALDRLAQSPAHYRAWVEGPQPEPTAAMRFGSAFHALVLEPEHFAARYVVRPEGIDGRTKDGKAWLAQAEGRTVLSADEERHMLGMHAAIYTHPAASKLILAGKSEVSLRWTDEITGIACKSRADYWVPEKRLVVDLKSTDDASPSEFAKSVARFRYHIQDAMYRAAFDACGHTIDHFALVAVEKSPPYAVAVYTLDADAVRLGYAAFRQGLETMAECLRTNHWPAYDEGVAELQLPKWAS